ncbi:MAG: efflux RND transporter periplasmic adaptor subunit [Rhodocyclaceae bacterium]|nr:efflux RND transporter periplasmic adaptor subunit [Rhodocyclaceae bacterium]
MNRLLPLLLAALLLAGCKESPSPAAQPPADPLAVTAPESLAPQLRIETVGKAPVADILRVAGRIDFDEARVARIGATVTGRVTELQAALGDPVKAGDTLAQLHSTELGNAQLAYLKARAHAELTARAVDRARLLLSADVIGAAELQRRENELAVAQAERRAAADQLRVLGVSAAAMEKTATTGAINSVSSVVSTIAGVVVERKVARGQVVQPSDALFTVADLSRVWVIAQVPEAEVALVSPGQSVEIEVPALGNAERVGRLIHVGDVVNPETRTVMVRTEIDNRDRQLKPAMLATMLIQARPVERLVVPAAAVVREENEDHVFLEVAPGRYRLARVKLGPEHDGRRAVLAGLAEGARVVAAGAFHLNNERRRKELEGS